MYHDEAGLVVLIKIIDPIEHADADLIILLFYFYFFLMCDASCV